MTMPHPDLVVVLAGLLAVLILASAIGYGLQRKLSPDGSNVVVENLKKIGRTAGMEDAALDTCMKDGAMAEAMVARSEANMAADKVEGTPTLTINGVTHSNMAYAELKALIDAELAK